jgi:uncharacterized 2Fe-2S/4Fe-4S cluster protein (DUF4445 family)
MSRIVIREPDGRERRIDAAPDHDRSLAELLSVGGSPLNTRCGKRGLCRGCEVELTDGELEAAGEVVRAPATVRSCQARLRDGDIAIAIPPRSRMEHRPQIGETFRIDVPSAHQPLFPPGPDGRNAVFAVDIGTTTVVVLVIDGQRGDVLGRAGGFNQQIRFGDNVLTRIAAGGDPAVRREMQEAIAETITGLLDRACERAGLEPSRIAGGAIAANTTMLHLLVGEDPSPLGVAPFRPGFVEGRRIAWSDTGARSGPAPGTPVHLLPGIAGYLGADIVAGIYATGMVFDEKPSLLVDIGTNGEVVLQSGGRLSACATAAGPAFEGCGLRCGSRAVDGAISDIRIKTDPIRLVAGAIGDVPLARAGGICGSAYIDFLAQARTAGLLGPSGRFEADAWQGLPEHHRLIDDGERVLRFTDDAGRGDTAIGEVDVALLLQAKAAIGAGIETLLEQAGIEAVEVGRLCLAGGFGMHLDVPHAIAIGLLPGFRPDQVEVVGNTALAGALLALMDCTTLDEMESLRRQVEVLELNLQEGFEDRYVDHLFLP